MARRKKELAEFHREAMIAAAEKLFQEKGIERTKMDDIASEAQYSKATLYVYFKNKEEMINCLTLKSMKLLHERIKYAIAEEADIPSNYYAICKELAIYHDQHPVYYNIALGEINVDLDNEETPAVFREIFEVGEQINGEILKLLIKGMETGVFRNDLSLPQDVFFLWAGLSGVIQISGKKKEYIEHFMGTTLEEFRESGFKNMLRSILK